MSTLAAVVGLAGALVLLLIAAVHVYWAEGGSWPGSERAELPELVIGPGQPPPPRLASWAVAALLLAASVLLTAAAVGSELWVVRAGSLTVAAVLALRGAGGLVVSGLLRRSSRFAALDRTVYSPLCLGLAVAAMAALAS